VKTATGNRRLRRIPANQILQLHKNAPNRFPQLLPNRNRFVLKRDAELIRKQSLKFGNYVTHRLEHVEDSEQPFRRPAPDRDGVGEIQQLNRKSAANLDEGKIRGGSESEEDAVTETPLAGEQDLESDVGGCNPFLNLILKVLPRHLVNILAAELP